MADGACAVGRIEAEGARLKLRNGNAAIGAGEFFGVNALVTANDGDGGQAAGEFQRSLDGFFEALK